MTNPLKTALRNVRHQVVQNYIVAKHEATQAASTKTTETKTSEAAGGSAFVPGTGHGGVSAADAETLPTEVGKGKPAFSTLRRWGHIVDEKAAKHISKALDRVALRGLSASVQALQQKHVGGAGQSNALGELYKLDDALEAMPPKMQQSARWKTAMFDILSLQSKGHSEAGQAVDAQRIKELVSSLVDDPKTLRRVALLSHDRGHPLLNAAIDHLRSERIDRHQEKEALAVLDPLALELEKRAKTPRQHATMANLHAARQSAHGYLQNYAASDHAGEASLRAADLANRDGTFQRAVTNRNNTAEEWRYRRSTDTDADFSERLDRVRTMCLEARDIAKKQQEEHGIDDDGNLGWAMQTMGKALLEKGVHTGLPKDAARELVAQAAEELEQGMVESGYWHSNGQAALVHAHLFLGNPTAAREALGKMEAAFVDEEDDTRVTVEAVEAARALAKANGIELESHAD
jgi:hypothetical protein